MSDFEDHHYEANDEESRRRTVVIHSLILSDPQMSATFEYLMFHFT